MTAGIGDNSASFDQVDAPESEPDIDTAAIVDRVVRVLSSALGLYRIATKVLKKKQPLETLSLRQLTVYCLTHENDDLALVPIVKLSKIIGFDRGTVRDDRAMVERAVKLDDSGDLFEFVETARELALAVPCVAKGSSVFFLGMDIARSRSRERMRKLQEIKRLREEGLKWASRAEEALKEIGRHDLADHTHDLRKKEPWNPLTDRRPTLAELGYQ